MRSDPKRDWFYIKFSVFQINLKFSASLDTLIYTFFAPISDVSWAEIDEWVREREKASERSFVLKNEWEKEIA